MVVKAEDHIVNQAVYMNDHAMRWNAAAGQSPADVGVMVGAQVPTVVSAVPNHNGGVGGVTAVQAAELERRIARNVLRRIFSPNAASHLHNFLFAGQRDGSGPILSTQGVWNEAGRASSPEPENAWCRLEVENLKLSHYAKDPIPDFRICVRQLNGDPLPRSIQSDGTPKPMVDMRVKFSLYNKWANVTNEVLPDAQLDHTLVDGVCTVSGLIFHEVSVKHGGHFILKIHPLDFRGEVLPWKSPKLKIQSVKTHCLRKRKLHASNVAKKEEEAKKIKNEDGVDANTSAAVGIDYSDISDVTSEVNSTVVDAISSV